LAGIEARILLFFFFGFSAANYAAFSCSRSSFFCLHGALGTLGFFSLTTSSSTCCYAFFLGARFRGLEGASVIFSSSSPFSASSASPS